MVQHVGMSREGKGGGLAITLEGGVDGGPMHRFALLADKEALAGRLHAGALSQPGANRFEFVAAQGLRGR